MSPKNYPRFKALTIRRKLFLSYIIIILLPIILFIGANSFIARKSIEEQSYYSANQLTEQAAQYIQYKTNLAKNIANSIALNDVVHRVIKEKMNRYSENISMWSFDICEIEKQIGFLLPWNSNLNIMLYTNSPVVEISETNYIKNINQIKNDSWFESFKLGTDVFKWYLEDDKNLDIDIPFLSGYRKIKDELRLDEQIGLVRIDIPLEEINEILNKTKYTPSSYVLLFNEAGQLLSYSNEKPSTSFIQKVENAALNGNKWSKVYENTVGIMLYSKMYIEEIDWFIVAAVPEKEIIIIARKTISQAMLIFLIVAPLTLPLSYFIAVSLTGRLSKLSAHMNEIKEGNFDLISLPEGNDEIGKLTKHFNQMLRKVTRLLDVQYKLGKDIKNKELIALQTQINPHFLYNTLDQINWLALKAKAPEVSELVLLLSRFYKLSLSKGEDIVTIENELIHIETYVGIQNVRFDNTITLVNRIPKALYGYKIPKITLQPLVENSIEHGILEKEEEEGTIWVDGWAENDMVFITIKDDGIGMSKEVIENIFSRNKTSSFHGYGIRNIDERLKLLYGEDYGLDYESQMGFGTCVRITIPGNIRV
jgi:two-component system sensor histidine kinase YesM